METKSVDVLADLGITSDFIGTRYVDLGEIPTPEEERTAVHMELDDPPEEPRPGMSLGLPASSSAGPHPVERPSPAPQSSRGEPEGEITPDVRSPDAQGEDSSTSASDEDEEMRPTDEPDEEQEDVRRAAATQLQLATEQVNLDSLRPSRSPSRHPACHWSCHKLHLLPTGHHREF